MRSFRSFPRSSPPRSLTRRRAACLGPAMAAISLGLVGHSGIGERLGRNARFASIGNGFAAALMGACGYFFSARSVFVVTAILLLPTVAGASPDRAGRDQSAAGSWRADRAQPRRAGAVPRSCCRQRSLLILACCVGLFHLANAAMLPLMGSVLTSRSSDWATVTDRDLHRGTAARRRADRAVGRPAGPDLGSAPFAAAGIRGARHPRPAVCDV